jgi:hypothetical protein
MKFEMTKCNRCGSEMLMGVDVCPSCGKEQARAGSSYQPRTLLAVALAVAVLFAFNWMKPAPPHAGQVNSPPSAVLPSR